MGITAEVRASAAASVPPCDPSGLPVGLPESPEPRETSRFLLLPHYPYSDTSRTYVPNTRIYGWIKSLFPPLLATVKL
jgi:hypothetical protein